MARSHYFEEQPEDDPTVSYLGFELVRRPKAGAVGRGICSSWLVDVSCLVGYAKSWLVGCGKSWLWLCCSHFLV